VASSNRLIEQLGYGRSGCILNTGEERDLITSHTRSVMQDCDRVSCMWLPSSVGQIEQTLPKSPFKYEL